MQCNAMQWHWMPINNCMIFFPIIKFSSCQLGIELNQPIYASSICCFINAMTIGDQRSLYASIVILVAAAAVVAYLVIHWDLSAWWWPDYFQTAHENCLTCSPDCAENMLLSPLRVSSLVICPHHLKTVAG